ncbi:acetyl-CoA synthetase-like protein [Laetiporus sulphureus 93-53]|uniref:Acetyl-CoA synthetase-like protein n=1 Tax=Laetiporus sulphureus 93-53 TaxID=1314785 RepID=A0A165EKQ1_9APHY|nr:acetyl-CoA synthetase-like protein [Laetiporus sulphureus 93-53]KZT07261.1 acetyl-CoA synthetase-like protein [Laetiporus sulphureus 93-53]
MEYLRSLLSKFAWTPATVCGKEATANLKSADIPLCPPLDGSVAALPGFLDFHVIHNPSIPVLQFADATHRVAHHIRPEHAGPERAIVGMLLHCDILLYHAITTGAVRAGLVPFPMYTNLTAIAISSMLQCVDCHRADLPPSLGQIFPRFASASDASAAAKPSPHPVPSVSPAVTDVVLHLHSSGSPGLPKPIPQSGSNILHWCSTPVFLKARDRGIRWAAMAPCGFGTMGMCVQLYAPLVSGQPSSLFVPQGHLGLPPVAANPDNILDAARRTNANAIPTTPWVLELWAHGEENIKYLASLQVVMFAGAPMSPANGAKLTTAGVRLSSLYAATEFRPITDMFDTDEDLLEAGRLPEGENKALLKSRSDWNWIHFPERCKIRWVPQGSGMYELFLMSNPTHQPSVENLPNGEKGYATSDLWIPHPTKPNLWRMCCRTDGRRDHITLGCISFSNVVARLYVANRRLHAGWNFVPIPQESHLGGHPLIDGAVMFGRTGYIWPGVLIEPAPSHAMKRGDQEAANKFIDRVWRQIEEANEQAPVFGRIYRELIIVADAERPLPRAAKGTVQRKLALALYAEDIDALYANVNSSKVNAKC